MNTIVQRATILAAVARVRAENHGIADADACAQVAQALCLPPEVVASVIEDQQTEAA